MSGEDQAGIPERSARSIVVLAFVGVLGALLVYAMIRILAPFATPILLAAIVVTFTFPFYRKLRSKVGERPNLAASLMVVIVTFTIILPAFLLLVLVINEATTLFDLVHRPDIHQTIQAVELGHVMEKIHRVFPWLDLAAIDLQKIVVGSIEKIPGWVATYGGKFLASLTTVAVNFVFMLLAAYFFYLEGETLVAKAKEVSPLPPEYETQIAKNFTGVINATFRGQILTAVAQGAVCGVGFLLVGLPGAFFWGAIAAVASLVPVVGAAAVWVPATLYLFATAAYHHTSIIPGIVLAAWGIAAVSMVDNLIRPWAMRSGTNMSAILLFFSILGGVRAFGIVGLIFGPLVFVLLMTVFGIYEKVYASGGREEVAESGGEAES